MRRALLFLLVLFCLFFSYYGRFQPVSLDLIKPDTKKVELKGEVIEPGVYSVKWEANVKECIDEAGGLSPNADTSSLSLLMVAEPDSVIVVPSKESTKSLVSLNTASLEELDTLPGIGPSLAQRIIEYRKTTPFTTLEQIMEVRGIKEKLFEKIKDQICL